MSEIPTGSVRTIIIWTIYYLYMVVNPLYLLFHKPQNRTCQKAVDTSRKIKATNIEYAGRFFIFSLRFNKPFLFIKDVQRIQID